MRRQTSAWSREAIWQGAGDATEQSTGVLRSQIASLRDRPAVSASDKSIAMEWNALVPELVVADYARSKAFYVDVFGFSLRFERPETRFGYFDLGGAQIMLLEDTDRPIYQMHRPGPRGKGLHFQVEIPSVSAMLERLDKASVPRASEVVEAWYRQDTVLHGQREFFVADPDGYLYRFYESIGERPMIRGTLE